MSFALRYPHRIMDCDFQCLHRCLSVWHLMCRTGTLKNIWQNSEWRRLRRPSHAQASTAFCCIFRVFISCCGRWDLERQHIVISNHSPCTSFAMSAPMHSMTAIWSPHIIAACSISLCITSEGARWRTYGLSAPPSGLPELAKVAARTAENANIQSWELDNAVTSIWMECCGVGGGLHADAHIACMASTGRNRSNAQHKALHIYHISEVQSDNQWSATCLIKCKSGLQCCGLASAFPCSCYWWFWSSKIRWTERQCIMLWQAVTHYSMLSAPSLQC